ncbi:hypothetical protein SAMN04488003_101300 [Loktanella fryxellensis]|uniref:Glyoxalase/Bleomycin resistance protein/Dioxygenase superfamily protein n=1 Tax=Loktanella fryxellensis TaxID=245187 RepID=A0A1H7YV14_9RHOB|nr:hypothetical protein [Loktanella fryxellensis]SEM49228.1 hypothetical protein SAMN04488003_101300 [Loktanella fryxellensis]
MTRVFDHVTLGIHDKVCAQRLYDAVMSALDISLLWRPETMLTYGPPDGDVFGPQCDGDGPRHGRHDAFLAADCAAVDRFHAAAVANGGRDDVPPGLRTGYHPHY